MNVWKIEFSKEIGVSVGKLDLIMKDLSLNYITSLRDKRKKIIRQIDIKKIYKALEMK